MKNEKKRPNKKAKSTNWVEKRNQRRSKRNKSLGGTKLNCTLATEIKAMEIAKKIIAKYGREKFNRMTEAEIIKATKRWRRSWKAIKLVILSQQAIRQDRLTRLAEQTRERYHKNPELFLARRRAYRESHPEQIKAYRQAYYLKNRK